MAIRRCDSIKELRREFASIKSVVAGDTRFGAQALLFMCEKLEQVSLLQISQVRKVRKKRAPTAWTQAISKGMREGKSITQIAEEYKSKGQTNGIPEVPVRN